MFAPKRQNAFGYGSQFQVIQKNYYRIRNCLRLTTAWTLFLRTLATYIRIRPCGATCPMRFTSEPKRQLRHQSRLMCAGPGCVIVNGLL
jgi:hypothetical protein